MAKRGKGRRKGAGPPPTGGGGQGRRRPVKEVPTHDYVDADGNVLTLRESLSAGTIAKIVDGPAGRMAANVEDIWQRRTELLFERLAVSWVIADLPITDQQMLLGRYRMADSEERRWVRETLYEHCRRHIPGMPLP